MKNKYVLKSSLFLDDELVDYLNHMSQKGWKLDFMGYYYKFIPCNQSYKFQIDYNEQIEEYLEILNDYGYEEIKCGFDFHVYANKNLYAPDLNTEDILVIHYKLKKFSISKSVISFVLAIISFFLAKMLLKDIFLIGKGAYFYNPNSFWIGILFAVIMLIFIVLAIYNLSARRLLKKGIGRLKLLKTITIIKDTILIIIMVSLFIYNLINGVFFKFDFLVEVALTFIIVCGLEYFLRKLGSKKFIIFIEMMVLIIISPILTNINNVFENHTEKTDEKIMIADFPVNDDITSRFDTSYTKVVEFEHNTNIMDITREPILSKERYIECKNRETANEVFKYIVIQADKDNRELIDYQAFMKDKNRNTWSDDEISYRNYKQSLSGYKKIDHYYINENYVIMLHNNKIVQVYIKDNDDIDMILQKFVDFNL